jgi:hypothetical protein
MSTCSIISDLKNATTCGLCSGTPVNCGSLDPSLCLISDTANNDMRLFAVRYSPKGALDSLSTTKIEQNIMSKMAKNQALLEVAYPGAKTITWPEIQRCGYTRDDALNFGYSPTWPIMGAKYFGRVWNTEKRGKSAPVPLIFDYLFNPDIFLILIILIVVISVVYLAIRRRLHVSTLAKV